MKTITKELCGHAFCADTISNINKHLDQNLKLAFERPLEENYPYLSLDARYEKVREDGMVRSQAAFIAIGINWDGRRKTLAVKMANRGSKTSWKDFVQSLKERGLSEAA